ncbi:MULTISPECIES: cysteine-rich KTR domain-containing protein [Clostridium]|uniref:cysteine-rich KTR domain-containing protein n=1 Tax=Clostridium TaxID=1485 RepID=UPI0018AACC14|nr:MULTISPECIES: cysteine-rich KTR domain-containing protein [Clostridium]MDB1968017.1 cysteine-rich KTR domain-containing protein [Clostridium tertium]MDU2681608.1 cysteine-rich KTR domain-containing protein [Clostridium sp.]MDY4603672.1 cysteine-rich KTR domain-containing protein [Clostridium tertium]
MCKDEWILCPICSNKTRVKIRDNTVLENFPLFCSRCKKETIINVKEMKILVIKEPDAKTQSR